MFNVLLYSNRYLLATFDSFATALQGSKGGWLGYFRGLDKVVEDESRL
jgi:hypothetical protein